MGDFYVDNEAPFDGDGSIATPWDNIAGHTADLGAGDTMRIRGDPLPGRIYTEALIDCTNSGTNGNPITIKSYGAGEEVIIVSSGVSGTVLRITGDWWVLDDLRFDGDNYTSNRQIYLYGCNHVEITDCELYKNGGDCAILFAGVDHISTYVTIDGCTIYDTYKNDTSDSAGIGGESGANITITNNTIYDFRGDGVVFYRDNPGTVDDVLVEDNHVYTTLGKCSENAIDFKRGTNITIRGNVMHGFRYCDSTCGGSGGGIGAAVIVQNEAAGTILIEENIIYDCTSGFKLTRPCTLQKNLLYDFVSDMLTGAWMNAGVCITEGGNNIDILNNTFSNLPEKLFRFTTATGNILIKNNLSYLTNRISINGGVTYTADYNGWYSVVDSLVGPNDTVGVNPQFVGGGDYHLQATSTAIDAGVDVGLPFSGPAPDLGCYETDFGTSTSTTTTSTSSTTTSTSLTTTSISTSSTSLSTTSTSLTTTSTSTTSTSLSTTSTSGTSLSTSLSQSTSTSLSTSLSTTSTSVSTTSSSTTSTSVSTTSTSVSTTSSSTTSSSTTVTRRLRFWLRGTLAARYEVRGGCG